MNASALVFICGTSDAWKVAEPSDPLSAVQEREVLLEIQGDAKNGYHLVMIPKGCFTADTWHPTIEDAIDTAHRLFAVRPEAWS